MRKLNEENERIKRRYTHYLKSAKGMDKTSIDKALAALLKFEETTAFKDFKRFHIEQAVNFRNKLEAGKNAKTKKPLGLTTIDATLRLVKSFFHWLAGQQGFKSVVSYSDTDYFNNNRKNARIAHTQREQPTPTMVQAKRAFEAMAETTDVQKRDKAVFAFLMVSGVRITAASSIKIKHVNLEERLVRQDNREVKTKAAKHIDTWFFPTGDPYRLYLEEWINHLLNDLAFGMNDALFPKSKVSSAGQNGFVNSGLSKECYSGSGPLNAAIKQAFMQVQMPEYTAHSFRRTISVSGRQDLQRLDRAQSVVKKFGPR